MICNNCGFDNMENSKFCQKCGNPVAPNSDICESCGAVVENVQVEQAAPAELAKPENVGAGILGALIGAIIGGASIVLLSCVGSIVTVPILYAIVQYLF